MDRTSNPHGWRRAVCRWASRLLRSGVLVATLAATACSGGAPAASPTQPAAPSAAPALSSPAPAAVPSSAASPSAVASPSPAPQGSPVSSAVAQQALQALIQQANQEGDLEAEVVDTAMPAADSIKASFLQHFQPLGLNITMNIGAGNQPTVWANMGSAIALGSPPQYDASLGEDDEETYPFRDRIPQVANWQALLTAINPAVANGTVRAEDVSPTIFAGYAFKFDDRLKVLVFNPNVITKDNLPKTFTDWVDPRYKGQYPVPPYAGPFTQGSLVYPQAQWLQMLGTLGQNAAEVDSYAAGIQKILSGQLAFEDDNLADYFTQKGLSANAPVDYAVLQDFTAQNSQFYSVLKGAKHPAAGTLFALWETTDEARAAWAPAYVSVNVTTGHAPLDQQVDATIKSSGSRLINFFDTTDGQQLLQSLDSPDGTQYMNGIVSAITQNK